MKLGKSLMVLSVAALAAPLLAACNNGKNTDSNPSSTTSETTSGLSLIGTDKRDSFKKFDQYKSASSSAINGYYDNTQSYKVGDDNPFCVRPDLTVIDENEEFIDQSQWNEDFEIKVVEKGQTDVVGTDVCEIVDAKLCNIQFKQPAVGKTYVITVYPTKVTADEKEEFKQQVEVEVIDGYNAYHDYELGLLDTRSVNPEGDICINYTSDKKFVDWYTFLSAKGFKELLDSGYYPANFILQNDIKIVKDSVPQNLFVAEGTFKDSLVDWGTLLQFIDPEIDTISINGNYFQLDFSDFPRVKKDMDGHVDAEVISHANVMYVSEGKLVMKNINVTGNAPRTEDAAVTTAKGSASGGMIFVKGSGNCDGIEVYNTINRDSYISYFASKPVETEYEVILNKVKCSNNYNSFLYNWACNLTATNSSFKDVGGPIVLQDCSATDSSKTNSDITANGGMNVVGYDGAIPKTHFVDCELQSYVSGTEPWFQQFHVTELVPSIKAMSDLFAMVGKTFLFDGDTKAPTFYTNNPNQNKAAFNFIALNKDSEVFGLTARDAQGIVDIQYTEEGKAKKDVFNFGVYSAQELAQMNESSQELAVILTDFQTIFELVNAVGKSDYLKALNLYNSVCEHYECSKIQNAEDLGTAMSALINAAVPVLLGTATKYGVSYDPSKIIADPTSQQAANELQKIADGLLAVLTTLTENIYGATLIRTVNHATPQSAPAFQTNGGIATITSTQGPLVGIDPITAQSAQSIEQALLPISKNHPFIANAGNYLATYFMGMNLVFELADLTLPQ